jgi:hypothetical protein
MSTVREKLIEYLTAVCAETEGLEKVKFVTSARNLGNLSQPTLILAVDSYEPTPAAPAYVQGNFVGVLVSNHLDLDKAEQQLDELLAALLPKLFGWGVMYSRAVPTDFDDQHRSFDISFSSTLG